MNTQTQTTREPSAVLALFDSLPFDRQVEMYIFTLLSAATAIDAERKNDTAATLLETGEE